MQQLYHGEPPLGANDTPPRSWLKAMGPMGWPADQGGRPALPGHQPPPAAGGWACLGLLLSKSCGTACLNWICFNSWATLCRLSLNRCSDNFCNFMSGHSHRRDKLNTWNMRWQTPSERSRACQRGTPCHANACDATSCFCHARRIDTTK